MSRADMQLLGRDLTTQAAALAAGELSSVELVGQVLAAIDASQPAVNSYIAVDADAALAAASASDQRRARGQAGALEGLPVAVKDNIDVAGVRTTAGMGTRRDAPPASADVPRPGSPHSWFPTCASRVSSCPGRRITRTSPNGSPPRWKS